MTEYLEILTRSALFAGVDSENAAAMLNCLGARLVTAKKGEYIFREGDRAQWVGMVAEGMVQIVRDDFYGNRTVMTAAQPGHLFGEMFACANIEFLPVSVIAVQDSRVILMDCRKILTVCSNACIFHNRIIRNLLQAVAEKNILLSQKIRYMSRHTTREKLMAYLLDQAKRSGADEFTIPFDRQSLADYLGVERSAMSAEIGKLKREGLIDTKGSLFRVFAPPENDH